MEYYICNKCNYKKPAKEFYPYKTFCCKKCIYLQTKKWGQNNPDKLKEYRKAKKEQTKKYYKEWYRKNGRTRKIKIN